MIEPRLAVLPKPARTPNPILPGRVRFLAGLAPFTNARYFKLCVDESLAPFLRMKCEEMDLAFVLISPFTLMEEYRPEFSETDIAELELPPEAKPLLLSIVNLSRGVQEATANLAGPLLINPATGEGKQVILVNAGRYSVRHRLLQS